MAYYLLEAKPAVKLFEDRMKAGGATPLEIYGPPGTPTCADGSPSWFYADGGGISALGCYVDSGRSNVRIIQDATACKQLDVGNRRLKRPVMYVAMSGAGTDIVPLYDWAVRGRGVIETIDRPGARSRRASAAPERSGRVIGVAVGACPAEVLSREVLREPPTPQRDTPRGVADRRVAGSGRRTGGSARHAGGHRLAADQLSG